jgi:hypothetical protein
MSKEYPSDRKQQNHEDQERMSRILNRRAEEARGEKKPDKSSESDESTQAQGKARAAGAD